MGLSQYGRKNLNFAGPGRQSGYFPCSPKESHQRKDVRLTAGTPVAERRLLLSPPLQLRAGASSSVPIASRSGSFSSGGRLSQTPALLGRETRSRDRAAAARQWFPRKETLPQLTPPPTAETSSRPQQKCPPPGESRFLLTFWRPAKSKASGGTRPAGFDVS